MSDKPFKDERIFIQPPNHVSLIGREYLESLQSELTDLRSRLEQSEAEAVAMREALLEISEQNYEVGGQPTRRQLSQIKIKALNATCTTSGTQLLAELTAARSVVEAVRLLQRGTTISEVRLERERNLHSKLFLYDSIVNQQPK